MILHFSGRGAPTFVFHFYKTRGFSNTKVGARKPPYFCLRALSLTSLDQQFKLNVDVTTGGGELVTYTYDISYADEESFQEFIADCSNMEWNTCMEFVKSHDTKFWKQSKGTTYKYWLDDQDKINSVVESSELAELGLSEG